MKTDYLKLSKIPDLTKGQFFLKETRKFWFKVCCPKCGSINRLTLDEPFVFPANLHCDGHGCDINFLISEDKIKILKDKDVITFNPYRKKDRDNAKRIAERRTRQANK